MKLDLPEIKYASLMVSTPLHEMHVFDVFFRRQTIDFSSAATVPPTSSAVTLT